MKRMHVSLKFLEESLGMMPGNDDIFREFIASKAEDAATIEDEVAAIGVNGVIEKGMTVFARNEAGEPCFYDYQIKGFCKDCCGALSRIKGKTKSSTLKAYKKVIDGLIFVEPRMIPIKVVGEEGVCQRPLRAATPQGERVALAMSQSVPAGSTMEFDIILMDDGLEPVVREWLNYGHMRGLGQWRNSGKGKFHSVVTAEDMADVI